MLFNVFVGWSGLGFAKTYLISLYRISYWNWRVCSTYLKENHFLFNHFYHDYLC